MLDSIFPSKFPPVLFAVKFNNIKDDSDPKNLPSSSGRGDVLARVIKAGASEYPFGLLISLGENTPFGRFFRGNKLFITFMIGRIEKIEKERAGELYNSEYEILDGFYKDIKKVMDLVAEPSPIGEELKKHGGNYTFNGKIIEGFILTRNYQHFLSSFSENGYAIYIMDENADINLTDKRNSGILRDKKLMFIIGDNRGFNPEDIRILKEYTSVKIGNRPLLTSTVILALKYLIGPGIYRSQSPS